MKKADILVILLVLLLSVSFYVIYFTRNVRGGDLIVEITYQDSTTHKNQVIYYTKLEESTDVRVEIRTDNKILYLTAITPSGEEKKNIPIASDENIENIVDITYDEVRMHYANCTNKYCYRTKIHRNVGAPIICTNGIFVKLISEDYSDYEIML